MGRQMRHPVTGEEEFLAAVYGELEEVNRNLSRTNELLGQVLTRLPEQSAPANVTVTMGSGDRATAEAMAREVSRTMRSGGVIAGPAVQEASAVVVGEAAATEPAQAPGPGKPSEAGDDGADVVEVREPNPPPKATPAPRTRRTSRNRKQQ